MTHPASAAKRPAVAHRSSRFTLAAALLAATPATLAVAQQGTQFTPGYLVVAVEGCGVQGGTCTAVPNGTGTGAGNSAASGYGDNQAAPLTLFQFSPVGTASAAYVNSLVLPQTASGANLPVSGEYGSSSEATLQLSGSGKYLAIMGYGIPAATFDASPTTYGAAPSNALAQSGSLTGQSYTPVARVLALIDANGRVNSTTALFNIFNLNNPRSAYTQTGASAYVSGQGSGSDATGGVFFTGVGTVNTAPTAITGLDTTNNTIAQDTREVQVYNNTLFTSVDTKAGSNAARDFVGTIGTAGAPPTTLAGAPVMLPGYGSSSANGKLTITTGANSTGNAFNAGLQINLSPNNFFFANPATLYVADGGNPKNNSASSSVGDGGLQKWINSSADGSGTWSLAYTLYKGLNLVLNTTGTGASGLYGLTGTVVGGNVLLYATDYTLNDLDITHLYGVTDTLGNTTASQAASETFSLLATAPSDSNFKGVAFAPSAPPTATPTITWPTPAAVTYGTALSSVQLDATASVAGTFSYAPAAGTVLPTGTNQLAVTFTPTDLSDYTSVTSTTTLTVNAATVTPANVTVTRALSRSGSNILVQLTLANTGGTAATAVTVTGVKVGSTAATPATATVGTLAPGTSATASFTVPGTTGNSGQASSLTVTGTYAGGGTFTSSARITLP